MPRRNPNLFFYIISREVQGTNAYKDLKIIRKLIENSGVFKKVWEKSSKSPIVYEGSLFFDAYRTCYDLNGLVDKPRVLYRLPKLASGEKIEAVLEFDTTLDQTTFAQVKGTPYEKTPYNIGLTAGNRLKTFEKHSGKTLEEIYLSDGKKFKYLSWETDLHRILVKSTLSPNSWHRAPIRGMHRVPRSSESNEALLYLAVLSVSPLQFLCMLPISKSVFGQDVCNASVREDLLIVMHTKGRMRFYSFSDIIKHHSVPLRLGDQLIPGNKRGLPELDEFACGIVGTQPIGLPVNVCLCENMPILFEVFSYNHEISVGGFPWHYIQSTGKVFQVRSVKDNTVAVNGTLENKVLSLESDKAFFHADLSGRILHIGPSYLRCLRLEHKKTRSGEVKYSLSEQFVIDYCQPRQSSSENCLKTKSGRLVKQLINSYHGDIEHEIVQDVDCDDELDVLVVLYLDQTARGQGLVGFYDNQTGNAIHRFSIGDIDEEGEHSVAIDRNILVIISKNENSFICRVYTLVPTVI